MIVRSAMLVIRSLVFVLAFSFPALAQHFSHPLAMNGEAHTAPRRPGGFPDSVRVLAVMVRFAQDNDVRTSGDGRFVLSPATSPVIDATPHDREYFADHLTFLSNYFRKASKGRTLISWTVLDSAVTLPSSMATYAPQAGGSNLPLAALARDTWTRVDSSGAVPDFSHYDCFVLFHAGVGHDIDIIGTIGYDPTPLDIPSLYLGPVAFSQLLGSGIKVNGGRFTITNTIILPETESRTVPGVTGDVLLQLGLNGLLCASMGNYLGLPDLFDTQTGASGIGRFGLMDSQAIFSFSGVFPPEPSAWEKYWLGWVRPITVPAGTSVLTVPAVALADTVYRIPVSDGEYFLLENRNRDPRRTGQKITSVYNGITHVQSFVHDTTGFNSADISALYGTITDVDVLDWSLPGGVDTSGTFFDGGILLWHIDEAVIGQTIAVDQVNANPDRRGVNLEEADGSQDIGQSYDMFSAGSGSEEGTALDFWYKGNGSPVNTNEFSASTHPSSNSNLGALSHVTVNNFSVRGPVMTASVLRGEAVRPVAGYPRQLGESVGEGLMTVADLPTGPKILFGTPGLSLPVHTTTGDLGPAPIGGKLFLIPPDSSGGVPPFRSSGVFAVNAVSGGGFGVAPAAADLDGDGIPEIISVETDPGAAGSVRALSIRSATPDSLATVLFVRPVPGGPSTAPVVSDSLIAVGSSNGTLYFLRFDGTIADSVQPPSPGTSVSGISRWSGANAFVATYRDGTVRLTVRTTTGNAARPDVLRGFGANLFLNGTATGSFGRKGAQAAYCTAFVTADGRLFLVDSTLAPLSGFPVSIGLSAPSPPVMADIDGDGILDIVLCVADRIYAYNLTGALLENFPIRIPFGQCLSQPLVGDVDGDGQVEVVAVSADGLAYAYNKSARPAPGFPLPVGSGFESAGLLTSSGAIVLATASGDGSVSAWITGHYSGALKAENYPWPQYARDSRHSGLAPAPPSGVLLSNDFFPKERAYNWPNPVYNGKTFFRYYVKDNASVNIRIFDLAGDLVTQLSGQGMGGIDNEVAWDVSNIQSGIYFARIEATAQGSSGVVIVKVAVVK